MLRSLLLRLMLRRRRLQMPAQTAMRNRRKNARACSSQSLRIRSSRTSATDRTLFRTRVTNQREENDREFFFTRV